MLNLVHVRSFTVLAEEGHFGRAARRLNLTQSPLSRQMQMLEQTVGATLLERTTRTVRLTRAGDAFLKEAYRLLEAADTAQTLTRQVAKGEGGLVRFGFTAASAYQALPRLVTGLRTALPDVKLVLNEMVTSAQIEALHAGRIDVGLMRPGAHGTDGTIRTVPLLTERFLLAAPRKHRLASEGRIAIGDLHDEPFVTWSRAGGRYFVDLLDALFRASGVRPRVVQQVVQTHAMLALVGAGLGVALVPESARSIRMSGVALRPVALPRTARVELHLAWRKDVDNPALATIRKVARASFAKAGA